MKWIKKFESNGIQYEDYFQDLIDNWYVGISLVENDKDYDLKMEINTEHVESFPYVLNSGTEITFTNQNFDEYLRFMGDLHKCITHFLDGCDGSLSFERVSQTDVCEVWVKFNKEQ